LFFGSSPNVFGSITAPSDLFAMLMGHACFILLEITPLSFPS
jgi:hypothetical protein